VNPSHESAVSQPTVSILIPTYNYARYLPDAIESVLGQDFSDLEVVIVDDCSRDDSAEVIQRYAGLDPRIRFHLNRRNLGLVANWNFCLAQARGRYIKFLFGDDLFGSPRTVSTLVALMESQPSVVLATSARRVIDADARPVALWDHLGRAGVYPGRAIITRCLAENRNLIGEPSAVLFRREDAARGFNPRYRQWVDLEMWLHLLERGDLGYSPEPLCCFRQHEQQQTVVNRGLRVGEREALVLLREYYYRPWIDRRLFRERMFRELYYYRRQHPSYLAYIESPEELMGLLGRGWYFAHWVRRNITKALVTLRHNWQRHILDRKPVSLRRRNRHDA
jgi:glycosyltransferase involved in cell wall biosynthesis